MPACRVKHSSGARPPTGLQEEAQAKPVTPGEALAEPLKRVPVMGKDGDAASRPAEGPAPGDEFQYSMDLATDGTRAPPPADLGAGGGIANGDAPRPSEV